MSERCVCCGAEIPEGRQVCPICEEKAKEWHISKEVLIKGGDNNGTDGN